ncbi:DNA primase [Spiroplasma sp. DGKH1]|uniref:DNA primase n=1 Tax=Spiroplasma sp. DGKH1 TaxID=3050074 RepID=UPI0034C66CE9
MLSKEQIEEIVKGNDIVKTITNHVNLNKRGRDYIGLCPFHQDSNPSFSVSPERQWYKCFSCNESGNSLNFIQKISNISFPEALQIAADNANLKFESLDNYKILKEKHSDEEIRIIEMNRQAALFYQNNLSVVSSDQREALAYLESRNIDRNDINKFSIGLADSNSTKLADFLEKKGFSLIEIKEAGLIRVTDDYKKHYDFFTQRIMFPIKDKEGNIIGFSGRTIGEPKEGIPKYLNTAETKIFKKSQLMYNIDQSVNEIKKQDDLIILEGYMDAIALSKENINNTIAIMGTSLSDYHIKEISKLTKNVTVFLDGDKPGMDATLKISKQLLDADLTVNVVNNSTDKDPDELIQSKENIQEMINNKMHPMSWLMTRTKNMYNTSDLNSVKKYIYSIGNMMISIKDNTTKEFYLNCLAKETNMSREMVNDILGFKTNSLKLSQSQNMNEQVTYHNKVKQTSSFNDKYTSVIQKNFNIKAESAGGKEFTSKTGEVFKTEASIFLKIPSFTQNNQVVNDYAVWISRKYIHELKDKSGNIKTNDPRKEYVLKNDAEYTLKFINSNKESEVKPDIKILGKDLASILKTRENAERLDYQNYKDGLKQNSPQNKTKEANENTRIEQLTLYHAMTR